MKHPGSWDRLKSLVWKERGKERGKKEAAIYFFYFFFFFKRGRREDPKSPPCAQYIVLLMHASFMIGIHCSPATQTEALTANINQEQ